MVKCIAIDMDGTLLNSEHEITLENAEAIKKAQSSGVEVVITTGRSYPEAVYILEEAGIKCPFICANGAEERSPKGEIITANPLSKEITKKVLHILIENDVYLEVFANNGIYTTDLDRGIKMLVDLHLSTNPESDVDKTTVGVKERFQFLEKVDSFDFLFEENEIEIYKLLCFSFNDEALANVKESLDQLEGIAVSSSGFHNLEVNSLNAQKGVALEAFVAAKGISLEETMAIGDNYNDLSMFKKVGRAVAMGNAADDIKELCHFVTGTNEENGVGKAILEALQS